METAVESQILNQNFFSLKVMVCCFSKQGRKCRKTQDDLQRGFMYSNIFLTLKMVNNSDDIVLKEIKDFK